jgi:hypothetical protein
VIARLFLQSRPPKCTTVTKCLLLQLGGLRGHRLPLAVSLDPSVSEAILAAYILPLIRALRRAGSGGHSGVAVNVDFQVAQFDGLETKARHLAG